MWKILSKHIALEWSYWKGNVLQFRSCFFKIFLLSANWLTLSCCPSLLLCKSILCQKESRLHDTIIRYCSHGFFFLQILRDYFIKPSVGFRMELFMGDKLHCCCEATEYSLKENFWQFPTTFTIYVNMLYQLTLFTAFLFNQNFHMAYSKWLLWSEVITHNIKKNIRLFFLRNGNPWIKEMQRALISEQNINTIACVIFPLSEKSVQTTVTTLPKTTTKGMEYRFCAYYWSFLYW